MSFLDERCHDLEADGRGTALEDVGGDVTVGGEVNICRSTQEHVFRHINGVKNIL